MRLSGHFLTVATTRDESQMTVKTPIPFNKPSILGKELYYVSQSVLSGQTCGDGPFSKRCQSMIEELIGARHVLLTTSCGSALHIAALLCDLKPGDEVIMPSYGGAAVANAFHAVGARLVFVEVDADTLNIDLDHVEASLTERTRVIVPRHYFGTACDMGRLTAMADGRGIRIVEDVTDGLGARFQGDSLGTIGDFGAFSFHETADVACGEAGALVIKDPEKYERAEIIREKGTNRSQFFRGQVDKYTWVDVGSSYVPSDLLAAFLAAQLEHIDEILARKESSYRLYQDGLASLVAKGLVQCQTIPPGCQPNHHGFVVLVESRKVRDALIDHLASENLSAVFHFTPLHESRMGQRLGYEAGMLPVTESVSHRVIRLPFFHDLQDDEVQRVVGAVYDFFSVGRPT